MKQPFLWNCNTLLACIKLSMWLLFRDPNLGSQSIILITRGNIRLLRRNTGVMVHLIATSRYPILIAVARWLIVFPFGIISRTNEGAQALTGGFPDRKLRWSALTMKSSARDYLRMASFSLQADGSTGGDAFAFGNLPFFLGAGYGVLPGPALGAPEYSSLLLAM